MKVAWSIPEGDPSVVWTDAATGFFQESKNRDVCGLLVALWTIRESFSLGEFGFFENPWTRHHAWIPSIARLAPRNMVGYGSEAPSEFGALTKLLNLSR